MSCQYQHEDSPVYSAVLGYRVIQSGLPQNETGKTRVFCIQLGIYCRITRYIRKPLLINI